MKKIFFLFLFFPFSLISQVIPEFVTKFYFADNQGNKDTIEVGFDKTAKVDKSIQPQFGEIDITNELFKKFDVRIGNPSAFQKNDEPYSKRKINNFEKCGTYDRVKFAILIRAKNFPVTMKWDNDLFKDSCLKSSVFTRSGVTLLYDANEPTRRMLKDTNELLIDKKYMDGWQDGPVGFLGQMDDSTLDSVQVFYMFFTKNRGGVGVNDNLLQDRIELMPNPVLNNLMLKLSPDIILPEKIQLQILSTNGQILQQEVINGSVQIETDVSNLPSGLYFLQLRSPQGLLYTEKFVKID
jgi:hypothetical protein